MRRTLAAAFCAALAAFAAGSAPAHGADPGLYVALGDSYTAAPLVPNQYGNPIGCLRSDHNYPSLVKGALGVTRFRDESCSSATTFHMTSPQPVPLGVHAPQFDALALDAALVTVGIGGNDVGLVGAAIECLTLGATQPTGTACRSNFARPGGRDALVDNIAATAPRIAATLQGIHEQAPDARVLIVGYPAVAPHNGKGCFPLVPLSDDDIAYLDGLLVQVNAMLAEQAAANDAEYVDTFGDSIGHDVCTLPGTRWFEGLVPTSLALSVHPNALGEASMARSVLRVLGEPRPGPVLGGLRAPRRAIAAGRAARFEYTLNRAASVTFSVRRSRGGGRYSKVLKATTADGQAGANALTLGASLLGRRPGLYRLSATASGGPGVSERVGAPQVVHYRIKRASR